MVLKGLRKCRGFLIHHRILYILLPVTVIWIFSCNFNRPSGNNENPAGLPQGEGEKLARLHCGGCHMFPGPALLDKRLWTDQILPVMAHRLGVGDHDSHPLRKMSFHERYVIDQANLFPSEAKLSAGDWEKIVTYYRDSAPEKISNDDNATPLAPLDLFEVRAKASTPEKAPLTTLVHIDTVYRQLIIGDRYNNITINNLQGEQLDQRSMRSPPVHCQVVADTSLYILNIGIMDPNDRDLGTLESIGYKKNAWNPMQRKVIAKYLKRPVHFVLSDFDRDRQTDLFMCNFGHYTGSFTLMGKANSGIFKGRQVLDNNPGARKVEVIDINNDGWEDLVVLMAQGDEAIIAYINKQGTGFEKRVLMRFPPVYGSSYFELVDWDGDNDLDIIYTNGDNADYSFSLKNYHGVRCFINQGDLEFEELFFVPIHGVTKSLTEDFDGDGDKDIAVIAYFADFTSAPEKGFVYLENDGNNQFIQRTFEGSNRGRWLTMDKGDVDGDGDVDLLLGSFIYSATPVPESIQKVWIDNGYEYALLINSSKE